jgi:serine/threonine protein kinase
MAADAAIGPGTRIGDVVVERELGGGAFGVVYLGRDTVIGRPVALKVLRADAAVGGADRERFLAEARIAGSLRSPNLVTVHHVHRTPDGQWALEMEYVEGGSLADLLGVDLRLPPATAMRIGRDVLRGLARAHAAGVLHGDVKPANVLLAVDGVAKLADFGFARALGDRSADDAEWTPRGTPEYMAPEVMLGALPVARSDLWSVGVLLYRMLSGRLPFVGNDVVALFHRIQNASPPPLGVEVPGALATLVDRWLAKRPEDRRMGAEEACDVLDELLDGAPARVRPQPPPERARASAFVGRRTEVAALGRLLEEVSAGARAVVVVTGPEGIGKTTLLRQSRPTADRLGFTWVEAAVSAVEGMIRPLLRAARRCLVDSDDDSVSAHLDPERFGSAAPALRSLFAEGARVDLEARQQVVWALVHLLEGLAASAPLVVVVEDAHRADAQEAALLRDLATRLSSGRVLFALTYRSPATPGRDPGASGEFAEVEGATRIALGAMPSTDLLALLESRSGGARVEPEVVERVVRAAGGNPLFAAEMLRHLVETEAVVRRGDEWVRGPGWEAAAIPSRLADVFGRRIGRLPEAVRSVLDAAAVDGVEFDGQAVAAVLRRPLLPLLRQLQRLSRDEGLLVPTARGFRFAHALLHDLVYAEVAPELRHLLHRAFAEHLEDRASEVDPERLAIHWERAGDAGRARPHLMRAADAAIARMEFARAIDLARRAGISPGAVSPEDARKHRALLTELARAYVNTGAPRADVEALYETLLAAADADRDAGAKMRMIVRRAYYRFLRGGLGEGEEAQVRAAADLLPMGVDLGRARYLLGVAAVVAGETDAGRRWLRSADEVFAALPGAERHHASVLDRLASLANAEGNEAEAERLYAESAALSERAGMTTNAEVSRVNRLLVSLGRGQIEAAEAAIHQAIRVFGLARAHELAAHTTALSAQVRFALGDVEGAGRLAEDARRRLETGGYLPGLLAAHEQLAQVALVRGDEAAAAQSLESARAAAERRKEVAGLVQCDLLEAQLACLRGDGAGAERAVRRLLRRPGVTSTSVRREVALSLAELATWGLGLEVLDHAIPFVEAAPWAEALLSARAVLVGARQRVTPGGDGPSVAAAADILSGPTIGPRRSVRRIVAHDFGAVARRRAGDLRAADAELERALAACRDLGYAALEARLLRAHATAPPEVRAS